MSIKIDENNYEMYKQIFEIICNHLYKDIRKIITPESHPMAVLDNWETKNKTLARRGLREGLRDSLSAINQYPKIVRENINADLTKNNLPSLTKLTGIINDSIQKVLQTEKVKTLDQYYIIKELIEDMSSEISEVDRKVLSKYLSDFEVKATNR